MDQLSYEALIESATPSQTPQRGKPRDSLLLASNLRVPGFAQPFPVRVRNLSPGGLMAEYDGVLTSGDAVEIEVRGLGWVKGRAAWAVDGRVGISFDQEINPLAARKPVGQGRKA